MLTLADDTRLQVYANLAEKFLARTISREKAVSNIRSVDGRDKRFRKVSLGERDSADSATVRTVLAEEEEEEKEEVKIWRLDAGRPRLRGYQRVPRPNVAGKTLRIVNEKLVAK